ncbi:hypothetical protein, partial [Pseudonocardia sulfidoxydans]
QQWPPPPAQAWDQQQANPSKPGISSRAATRNGPRATLLCVALQRSSTVVLVLVIQHGVAVASALTER